MAEWIWTVGLWHCSLSFDRFFLVNWKGLYECLLTFSLHFIPWRFLKVVITWLLILLTTFLWPFYNARALIKFYSLLRCRLIDLLRFWLALREFIWPNWKPLSRARILYDILSQLAIQTLTSLICLILRKDKLPIATFIICSAARYTLGTLAEMWVVSHRCLISKQLVGSFRS